MCMDVLSSCMFACHVCAWYHKKPEKDVGLLGSGFANGCELPYGC